MYLERKALLHVQLCHNITTSFFYIKIQLTIKLYMIGKENVIPFKCTNCSSFKKSLF